jgi:hypothetical protein
MPSVLPPLAPEPLESVPEPRQWACERCHDPMRVWDWGNHPATTASLPPALCSACLLDLAPPEQQLFVYVKQHRHHQMWFRVGEPPGTLIAWEVDLPDQGGKVDTDGNPVRYTAYVYVVCVAGWNEDWPQLRVPWDYDSSGQGVILAANVIAAPDIPGSWRLRWWWPNPTWEEGCSLDPPKADLTDDDAVRLNRARRAFYAFSEHRGRPQDLTTWSKAQFLAEAPLKEAELWARYGRRPTYGELAAEMGISKPTFDRYKRKWGYRLGDIPAGTF